MKIINKIAAVFRRVKKPSSGGSSRGLVRLEAVKDVFRAEKLLKEHNYYAKPVAPPPKFRKGCDLAVEIDLVEQPGIERLLRDNKIVPLDIIPMATDVTRPLDVVKITDFEHAFMVRAGNMKLTIDKSTGIILNISGGGCPDVPYLHSELVGKHIKEVSQPTDLGFTLCALMLQRAYEECLKICKA